jgi:hypothetical protein
MFFITGMSTFTWVLIAYIGLNLGEAPLLPIFKEFFNQGYDVKNILEFPVLIHHINSKQDFLLRVRELFLIIGSLALFVEIAKAATASKFGASETLLSFVVSMIFIVMFFMVSWAQNATFLILGMMSLIDATGGFIIELNAARRDINVNGGGLLG